MSDPVSSPPSWLTRFRPHRLGLRSRILAIFTLGVAVLAAILAFTTYGLTRSTLLRQREESALQRAFSDARSVQASLRANPTSAAAALAAVPDIGPAEPLLRYRGGWTNTSPQFGPSSLRPALQRRVIQDLTASQMMYVEGRPVLAIGIPLPDVGASYFEIVPLDELSRTLGSIRVSLLGAAVITTALGVLLGAWAARRAVRPLADAAQAAQAIAGGGLGTRLEPGDDPDLQVLAGSFNDMASALQLRVERDARFASDVSHELRSPLTTLATSAQVLNSRRDELPEKAAAAVDLIVADVGRFQNLVEDLLEISRFDAGAVRLHREDLLVAELVRQAMNVSTLPEADLHVDPRAEGLAIQADKRRLARVLANLLENARYYGGGEVTVTVEPAQPEGEEVADVQIAVEDHGPGVPPDERLLIFERFARGVSAGRRGTSEGAGLGLALVDEHIRLHGGRVWVDDRKDGEEGARFVIELPAEQA
ncbi:MAG TPA: HAMP domain-containing sensor histidine kinase [Acidimicrobiales bacterium]